MDSKESLRVLHGVNCIAGGGICHYGLPGIDTPDAVALLLIGDIGRRAELYLLVVFLFGGSIVIREMVGISTNSAADGRNGSFLPHW